MTQSLEINSNWPQKQENFLNELAEIRLIIQGITKHTYQEFSASNENGAILRAAARSCLNNGCYTFEAVRNESFLGSRYDEKIAEITRASETIQSDYYQTNSRLLLNMIKNMDSTIVSVIQMISPL
jgi:hypothetical protein